MKTPTPPSPRAVAAAALPSTAAAAGSGREVSLAEQSIREVENWALRTRERT